MEAFSVGLSFTEKKARLEVVRENIARACEKSGRQIKDVKLLAVSKMHSSEDILDFYNLGLTDFGENYLQEAMEKISWFKSHFEKEKVKNIAQTPQISWHMIGGLQSNKAKFIPGNFSLFHCLYSLSLAEKLNKIASEKNAIIQALIEVNMNDQNSKLGISPNEVAPFLESLRGLKSLDIQGFMCIPDPEGEETKNGKVFAKLRKLLEQCNEGGLYSHPLKDLSMGMSDDYSQAIQEGATIIRVGTSLFGERIYES